jgi:hypothetical protein
MKEEKVSAFAVYWEIGDSNIMTSSELGDLPFDAASWASFLGLILGQRPYALMVMHDPNGEKLKVKVVPVEQTKRGANFGTIH